MGLFSRKKEVIIYAPVNGKIVNLSEVPDQVFSDRIIGDGVAIIPEDGNFVAPVAGSLQAVFPSGHAYGIKHKKGFNILLHIGLETVSMEGKGFEKKVKQGDVVKAGDPLAIVDLALVKKMATTTTSPIVVTSDTLGSSKIEILKMGDVKIGDPIFSIKS